MANIDENMLEASANGNITLVEQYLQEGAQLNACDQSGRTSLYLAASSGNLALTQYLVRRGANIFQSDLTKDNAITIAKKNGHHEIAKFLEQKIINRQQQTQSKFFNHYRSKKKETTDLVKHYRHFRHGSEKVKRAIEANHIPGRRLVMGDAGAVAESLHQIDKSQLTTPNKIAEHCRWSNKGYSQKGTVNADWSREYVRYELDIDPGARKKVAEEITVTSQYHPQPGHLGNFFMAGIGRYGAGDKKHILFVINETTRTEPADKDSQALNEKRLARLLLSYTRQGNPITTTALIHEGLQLFKNKSDRVRQLQALNRICYLAGVKEVTRRMHPGVRCDGTEVEELPMGVAYIMSLQLIADGYLSMQQVFDQNAEYGLPTATSISSDREIDGAKLKLLKLSSLFYASYSEKQPTREGLHQLLLSGFGGDSDTSGNEYDTEDEAPVAIRA